MTRFCLSVRPTVRPSVRPTVRPWENNANSSKTNIDTTSYVTCHMSHVNCHMSRVMCYMSRVT